MSMRGQQTPPRKGSAVGTGRRCRRLRSGVVPLMAGMASAAAVLAGGLAIDGFNRMGHLVFPEVPGAREYRVEWAMSPAGPWYGGPPDLTGLLPSDSGTGRVAVGIAAGACFYRLVADVSPAPQAVWFVASDGSDAGPGTRDQPFRTLEHARDQVRSLTGAMTGDLIVYLRGGTYALNDTLTLTEADSGSNGYRVMYRAYPGETPVISGGIRVDGWQPHQGSMYRAPLEREGKLRALYVNGRRAVMARRAVTARGGYGEYTVTAGEADWAWRDGLEADGVRYDAGDLADVIHPGDLEITTASTWNMNLATVRGALADGDQTVLLLQQPYGAAAQGLEWGTGLRVSGAQVLHNALAFLDQPGEFYFDRAARMLYYHPRDDEDMATALVIAPRLETLIRIAGASPDARAESITLQGLTVAHADWNLLAIGASRGQATPQGATGLIAYSHGNWHYDIYRAYDVPGAAVSIEHSRAIDLTRNIIRHTGCIGIHLANDVSDMRLTGNRFEDTGGSALVIGHPQHVYVGDTAAIRHPDGAGIDREKYAPETESAPHGMTVANNVFYDTCVLFHGHAPITVFYAGQTVIAHNHIQKAPYSGISFGWGWAEFHGSDEPIHPVFFHGDGVYDGATRTAHDNAIVRNRIVDVVRDYADGAGIYILSRQPGSVIHGNHIRDCGSGAYGDIYPDEGSSHIEISANVCESLLSRNWLYMHMAHDLTVDGNYTVNSNLAAPRSHEPSIQVTGTHVYTPGERPDAAQRIIDAAGLQPGYRDLAPVAP